MWKVSDNRMTTGMEVHITSMPVFIYSGSCLQLRQTGNHDMMDNKCRLGKEVR